VAVILGEPGSEDLAACLEHALVRLMPAAIQVELGIVPHVRVGKTGGTYIPLLAALLLIAGHPRLYSPWMTRNPNGGPRGYPGDLLVKVRPLVSRRHSSVQIAANLVEAPPDFAPARRPTRGKRSAQPRCVISYCAA
jgi:hypothetical protein